MSDGFLGSLSSPLSSRVIHEFHSKVVSPCSLSVFLLFLPPPPTFPIDCHCWRNGGVYVMKISPRSAGSQTVSLYIPVASLEETGLRKVHWKWLEGHWLNKLNPTEGIGCHLSTIPFGTSSSFPPHPKKTQEICIPGKWLTL